MYSLVLRKPDPIHYASMSIIPASSYNNNRLRNFVASAALYAGHELTKAGVQSAVNWLQSGGGGTPPRSLPSDVREVLLATQGKMQAPAAQKSGGGRSRARGRANRGRAWGNANSPQYPPFSNEINIRLHGCNSITNTAASTYAWHFYLCNHSTAGIGLEDYVDRLGSLWNIFQFFRIARIRLTFVPYVGQDQGGFLGLGYDCDTTSTTPTGLANISTTTKNLVLDLKKQGAFTLQGSELIPSDYGGGVERWLYTTPTASPSPQTSAGSIVLFSTNSLSSGSTIGILDVDLDIQFRGFVAT
jgi:hypothetical protein